MEQHLSQYKIFYEVARCGNISKAARELYISQPAISKAVSKLEENLGTGFSAATPEAFCLPEKGKSSTSTSAPRLRPLTRRKGIKADP